MLVSGAQRLAARSQKVYAGSALQNGLCEAGYNIDQVLAVVEHDKHRFVLERLQESGNGIFRDSRKAENGSQSTRDQADFPSAKPDRRI